MEPGPAPLASSPRHVRARPAASVLLPAVPAILAAAVALAALAATPSPARAQAGTAGAAAAAEVAPWAGLEWRFAGPYRGGRSTAVTGVPGSTRAFFMGSTGGGVWKTTDAGVHWENISDGHFGGGIGAVAVAPSDPSVLYAGTGSGDIRGNVSTGRGLWRSTDGGRSWTFAGLRESGAIPRIVVDPRDPDRVLVAALGHPFGKNPERGVFRSTDGGETWDHVLALNDSTGVVSLVMDPSNARVLYAGAWRAERKPWTIISGAEAGASGAGVWKSTDGGGTWEKLGGGLPDGLVGKVSVDVSASRPGRVWAMVQADPGGGLYRSDDAGASWRRVSDAPKLQRRAFYFGHVRADPNDENTVYVLTQDLHRSVDGGRTFDEIPVPHVDVHDVWIHPDDSRVIAIANDGGAQVSLNGGEDWTPYMNQPTAEFYDVVVDDAVPYRLYGAQQDNSTIAIRAWVTENTLNPKMHWENVGGCETGQIGVHPVESEVVFAGCYGGIIDRWDRETGERRWVTVYPENQGGMATREMENRFQWVSPIVVSPHDPDVVYHASQYVYRSTDRGTSWERISPDLTTDDSTYQGHPGGPIHRDVTGVETFTTVFSLAVSPRSPDVVWAGSDDGRVHVTRDGGESWTDVTPPGMPARGTVDEIDPSRHAEGRALVAVQRYREDDWTPYAFRTDDFGESWSRIADGTRGIPADHPVRTVREDPERRGLLFAGTEFGIFFSADDGGSWRALQLDLPRTPVTGMRVRHDDLIVATQGRGFWILDDIGPLREIAAAGEPDGVHLYTPSPVLRVDVRPPEAGYSGEWIPETLPGPGLIYYRLPSDAEGKVRLEITDAEGRTVAAFRSDSAAAEETGRDPIPAGAGMHRVEWDVMYTGYDRSGVGDATGPGPGVWAPPGEYAVRLVVEGETAGTAVREATLRVVPDPRLEGVYTQADYEAQLELGLAIRDTMAALHDAARAIGSVREQAEAAAARLEEADHPAAGEVTTLADSLVADLDVVEGELRRTEEGVGFPPPRLAEQYANLYGYVTGRDGYRSGGAMGAPTPGAYERFEDLNARWAELRPRPREVTGPRVEAFNAALRERGVPPVVVPPALGQEPGAEAVGPPVDSAEVRTHAAAMAAHHLCAGVFVVGRDHERPPEEVVERDIARFAVFGWRPEFRWEVDRERREAAVWAPDVARQTAEYNGDQGCTILPPGASATPGPDVGFEPVEVPRNVPDPAATPWPTGDLDARHEPLPPGVDSARLAAALDLAMAREAHNTRALLIVHGGRILAERYAEGFGPNTPQISWSQGKSITAALLGVAIREGALDLWLDDPAPVPEWRGADDPRREITLRHLLNMSSGLDFLNLGLGGTRSWTDENEHFRIYFEGLDVFEHAVNQPMDLPPGSRFRYRNSDPLTVGRIVRRAVEAAGEDYLTFPQRALFDRIGARSFVLETDPHGNFILTGYDFGSARDWARFGLLHLWDGVWEGERILPEGWVDFVRTPAPGDPDRSYGGFFWVNRGGMLPRAPEDAYLAAGFMGQNTVIVPSRDLVLVRLGPSAGDSMAYLSDIIGDVLEALPAP